MLVSINWLKRHIDLPESTTEIEKALTAVGLEVEGKKEPGKAFEKLIVGKVLTCERHPDSDHLHITTVDNGEEVIQVVCGAPNVAAGQTIVLAPLGAELPLPNGEKLKMKKTKIRGVESFGMICAEDEIGLSNDHAGIMVLEEGIKPGTLYRTRFLRHYSRIKRNSKPPRCTFSQRSCPGISGQIWAPAQKIEFFYCRRF